MQKRPMQRGRPAGTTTYEKDLAVAFGAAIREIRTDQGISQESLANLSHVERAHLGRIERGTHTPSLAIMFKIARALKCQPSKLMALAEAKLAALLAAQPED